MKEVVDNLGPGLTKITREKLSVTVVETGKVYFKLPKPMSNAMNSSPIHSPERQVDLFHDANDDYWKRRPIYCFLIEHPEGRFVIDTGDNWRFSVPVYVPKLIRKFLEKMRPGVSIRVEPEEEMGPRLKELGLNAERDVSFLILTHFHRDHTGGLYHFPHNRILAMREGFDYARSKKGKLAGSMAGNWPTWFNPEPILFEKKAVGPFEQSKALTSDGSVLVVPTPGHAYGHVSIIARTEGLSYFIAGDAAILEEDVRKEKVGPITYNAAISLETLKKIKAFASGEKTVILTSHDPEGPKRLINSSVFSLD